MTGSRPRPPAAFVGGFRSGTTLLINLLGLHPDLAAWFETKCLCEPLRWMRVLQYPQTVEDELSLVPPGTPTGFTAHAVAERARWHMRHTACRIAGTIHHGKGIHERYPLGHDYVLYSLEESERALDAWLSAVQSPADTNALAAPTGALIRQLGQRQAGLAGKSVWVNKTPEMPRFGRELRACLGRCRIVMLVRDGRQVVSSALALGWGTVDQLAARWRGLIEQSRAATPPGEYLELRFEDLLDHPARTLDRALRFLGVDACGQALVAACVERSGPIRSGFPRTGHPLSPHDLDIFHRAAGALQRELGYE